MFSASKTALIRNGVKVGEFDEEQTFGFALVKNKLRLASFTLTDGEESFSLDIKNNRPSVKFSVDEHPKLEISVTIRSGVSDFSLSHGVDNLSDSAVISKEKLKKAEEKTTQLITQIFEKCRALDCDLFELLSSLKKYETPHYESLKTNVLQQTQLSVHVKIGNIR